MQFQSDAYMAKHRDGFKEALSKILPEGYLPLETTVDGPLHWYRVPATNTEGTPYFFSSYYGRGEKYYVVVGGITHMPGCCGSCVVTGISVAKHFQRKGLGTLMGQLLLNIGGRYSQAIGTVVSSNEPMVRLVTKLGFDMHTTSQFRNRNTENPVVVCTRAIGTTPVPYGV